ncbi:DNA methylase [Treponema sp.]|uniref:Y-family DNA polymerase n=1 Tax=Treponema sp. TaxID=166 RepID=UPI00298E01EB|nr:DNA methylase [Treponema sp.]
MNRTYIAIDLKSFYASVECVERGMNPLKTNLLVADPDRSEKTICLAVSPSLKSFGVPGRPRLFEAKQKIDQANNERRMKLPSKKFFAKSYLADVLNDCGDYEIDYVIAKPRMALYIEYSSRIYGIYLKYIAPEDIHVYSIDEVFIYATPYLKLYGMTAHELTVKMIHDVFDATGITATAGIGPNLFIAKVAMDVVAKKLPPDRKGVRIAELDEIEFRKKLWPHQPITDIWRIGAGTAKRLAKYGIHTLGDIARCSIGKQNDFLNENLLYKEFGINAELLIDHAWGYEPCTIKQIKAYKPKNHSLTNGQVLPRAYEYEEGAIIVREMAELLSLDLVQKKLLVKQICLYIGYDIENAEKINFMPRNEIREMNLCKDGYGRLMPSPVQGRMNFKSFTQNIDDICDSFERMYRAITNPKFSIRRLFLVASEITTEEEHSKNEGWWTPSLFDSDSEEKHRQSKKLENDKAKKIQAAVLSMKSKYGKNTLVRGLSLQESAMTMTRNKQIGGHQA